MKYHLLFLLTNIPILFCAESKAAPPVADKLLSSIELSLQAYQQQRLEMDMPASSIKFDDKHVLWIAGQRSIWKWNITNKKLAEINLIKAESPSPGETLRHVETWNEGLLVASHQKLFKIRFEPLKVIEFKASEKNATKQTSYGFRMEKDRFFWIKSTGVWTMNQKNQVLTKWKPHPPLRRSDQVLLSPENRKLWIIRKNKLIAFNYDAREPKPKIMLEIKYKFTGIQQTDSQEIVLHTRHTVLLVDKDGSIKKTIPVESKRKLVLSDFHGGQHSYLFHDRFLEIHQSENMKNFYSKVRLGRVRKAGQMIAKKNIIGLILDGKPRVFQIEGQW